MGCNTSKESVAPVEGEEKTEDLSKQPENEDETKEPSTKGSSATTVKASPTDDNVSKSAARLSNHISDNSPEGEHHKSTDLTLEEKVKPAENKPVENGIEELDEEAAATKIQAVFRGHQTRRTMKQSDGKQQQEPEPTREQLEAEFRADDVELCKAATTIQNSFRSHMKSKQDGGKDGEGSTASKQENKNEEEELDIDLTDPELNKAATKIQASFRGHKVRKETEGVGEQ